VVIGAIAPMKNYFDQASFDIQNSLIGLILIITGIIFLFTPTNINLKIGICMIILGFLIIMIFNVNEKELQNTITGKKLIVILILWIFLIFIISYNLDAEIFLINVILGILILKEFLTDYMSVPLKKRTTLLFYLLIIVFITVIGQKVINIITI